MLVTAPVIPDDFLTGSARDVSYNSNMQAMPSTNPSDRGALIQEGPRDRRKRPSTIRVLFADDAPDARNMYGRYLQFRGLQVETACDGLEALQAVDSTRPDIIVLDLAMPRVTGWDVMRELRANPITRDIPIVALSGHDAQDSAFAAGADTYCEKPYSPEDLLRTVLRLLRWTPGTAQ
jgi:CheY-like chemotaxis protein